MLLKQLQLHFPVPSNNGNNSTRTSPLRPITKTLYYSLFALFICLYTNLIISGRKLLHLHSSLIWTTYLHSCKCKQIKSLRQFIARNPRYCYIFSDCYTVKSTPDCIIYTVHPLKETSWQLILINALCKAECNLYGWIHPLLFSVTWKRNRETTFRI